MRGYLDDMRNPKAKSLWEKLQFKKDFHPKIKSFRREHGIPDGGFASEHEYDVWWMGMYEQDKVFYFFECVKSLMKQFKVEGLEKVIERYVVRNKVEPFFIETANTTGCEFIYVDEDDVLPEEMPRMKLGRVYIEIGPEARMSDIKLFLEQRKYILSKLQSGLDKTKYKTLKDADRERYVLELNARSTKELQEMHGFKEKYREVMIVALGKRAGYRNLSESLVKKIIQRHRDTDKDTV